MVYKPNQTRYRFNMVANYYKLKYQKIKNLNLTEIWIELT